MSHAFGKLFLSMYDGTLASKGPWQALVTMQQFIALADAAGVVDMTPEAISRRTTIPLEIIQLGIAALELPDPESRSAAEHGRRIVRLAPGRSWGWRLVNHEYYRNLASRAQKAELNARNYEERKRQRNTGLSEIQTPPSENSRSQTENSEKSDSAHTEAEAEAEVENRTSSVVAREGAAVPAVTTDAEAARIREIAREWTAAANVGMDDNPALGDEWRPINFGRGDSLDVVETCLAAGVQPDEIARSIVYRLALTFKPQKRGESISSLAYFRERLVDVYAREAGRLGTGRAMPVAEVDISPTGRVPRTYADDARALRQREAGQGAAAAADSLGLAE